MSILRIKSISTQLAVFYTIASFVLLLIVTLSLYLVMINVLHETDNQFLSNKVDAIHYILKNKQDDAKALDQEVEQIPIVSKKPAYRYYTRILDGKKNVVAETVGASSVFSESRFFQDSPLSLNKEYQWWSSASGEHYLLMRSVFVDHALHKRFTVQAALDVSYQKKTVSTYRNVLAATLFFGTLFAVILGIFIARRAMHSLRDLTNTTQKITAHSLHQRLSPKNWPVELQALAVALNHMLERIEDSFFRLTQLSADLAHELRTPINNLIGQTEVLLTGQYSAVEYKNGMESNLEELQRISHLIEDLLFLSRAENPQWDIKKTLLSAEQEIDVVIEFYRSTAEEKNIELTCEGSAMLYVNKIMFRRMISNLIANALKYTPVGGWVLCRLQLLDNQDVQITVSDNGIGIAQDHLPKVFQRFYRTDAARSQDSGGIGLGLSIVKSIVELHQGQIDIVSQFGKGTTVQILLPKMTIL